MTEDPPEERLDLAAPSHVEILSEAGVRQALAEGDPLVAYDRAQVLLSNDSRNARLLYFALLALARGGATNQASSQISQLHSLVRATAPHDRSFLLDVEALHARLMKDRALELTGVERVSLALEASVAYERVYGLYRSPYAAVNAATLALVAGQPSRARKIATRVLRQLDSLDGVRDYWFQATGAEAALILGDEDAVVNWLQRAMETRPGAAQIATTKRQLQLICKCSNVSEAILLELRQSAIVHYSGNLARSPGDTRFDGELAEEIRTLTDDRFAASGVGWAHGSLGSGADIVIAELLLDQGAKLHVVLPVGVEQFERVSVRPGGGQWVRRFRDCIDRATSLLIVADSVDLGPDDPLYRFSSQVAMGQALNQAHAWSTEAEQIAVWDGKTRSGVGTATDIRAWRETGHRTNEIRILSPSDSNMEMERASPQRSVHTVLFGDFSGAARLLDHQLRTFVSDVLGIVGETLDDAADHILSRNTWGDGIMVVFSDSISAATSALDIQQHLSAMELPELGLPSDLRLRIALHAGPLLLLPDPVTKVTTFFGRELVRAARIEPTTPPGAVYATTQVAALLALDSSHEIHAEYVGRVETAKNFETIPIYVLRRHIGTDWKRTD